MYSLICCWSHLNLDISYHTLLLFESHNYNLPLIIVWRIFSLSSLNSTSRTRNLQQLTAVIVVFLFQDILSQATCLRLLHWDTLVKSQRLSGMTAPFRHVVRIWEIKLTMASKHMPSSTTQHLEGFMHTRWIVVF